MRDRFQVALDALFLEEGLYSNDPVDPGGETFRGIARKRHPGWIGWALVDAAKVKGDGWARELDRDPEMRAHVEAFYRESFWRPVQADRLPVPVGERVFNIAVNAGIGRAVELLQVALCAAFEPVAVDGQLGPRTLSAAELADPVRLFDALQAAQGGYYVGLIAANQRLRRFRGGWLARAFREHPALREGATA